METDVGVCFMRKWVTHSKLAFLDYQAMSVLQLLHSVSDYREGDGDF